jgi:hypothetical protein
MALGQWRLDVEGVNRYAACDVELLVGAQNDAVSYGRSFPYRETDWLLPGRLAPTVNHVRNKPPRKPHYLQKLDLYCARVVI